MEEEKLHKQLARINAFAGTNAQIESLQREISSRHEATQKLLTKHEDLILDIFGKEALGVQTRVERLNEDNWFYYLAQLFIYLSTL